MPLQTLTPPLRLALGLAASLVLVLGPAWAAGTSADADTAVQRGQRFFNQTHGREWSCASCHGAVPTQGTRHAVTGKAIAPLAPAFNPERFTDAAKTEKWFRRNCQDVLGRECTAVEKADVKAWLLSLKP